MSNNQNTACLPSYLVVVGGGRQHTSLIKLVYETRFTSLPCTSAQFKPLRQLRNEKKKKSRNLSCEKTKVGLTCSKKLSVFVHEHNE